MWRNIWEWCSLNQPWSMCLQWNNYKYLCPPYMKTIDTALFKTFCTIYYLLSTWILNLSIWISQCVFWWQRIQSTGDVLMDLTGRNISDYLVKTYPRLIKSRYLFVFISNITMLLFVKYDVGYFTCCKFSRFKIQEALFIPREITVQQLQYKGGKVK